MTGIPGFEALFLTLATLAFPFHGWLVMLQAVKAREEQGTYQPFWPRGVAKPGAEEDDEGTFSAGF